MRQPSYGKYPKLASWMKENNMTAKYLAKEMGVEEHTIWRLINGKLIRVPHQYTRDAFHRVTGMTIEEAMEVVKNEAD